MHAEATNAQSQCSMRLTQCYTQLVRWAFARLYREFAWTYDFVAWLVSRGLWHRWTLAALPYLHGRVLELGCGTGYVQQALALQQPGTTIGLDVSPQMLMITQRRLRGVGLHAKILRATTQALPFEATSFHSVLATFPSEYIVHPHTLAEIRRVLVPSGRLVIVDAAQFTSNGLYERAVDIAYRLTLQLSVREAPPRDPYVRMLEQAGFALETHWEPVGPSHVLVLVGTKCAA